MPVVISSFENMFAAAPEFNLFLKMKNVFQPQRKSDFFPPTAQNKKTDALMNIYSRNQRCNMSP